VALADARLRLGWPAEASHAVAKAGLGGPAHTLYTGRTRHALHESRGGRQLTAQGVLIDIESCVAR
jgi:hypothetical protein